MAKAEQEVFEGDGFKQNKIAAIERAADKADETRSAINGLAEELENREYKLREAILANEAECDHQEDGKGGKLIIYKRGDYTLSVEAKPKVKYKIKEASKEPASN